MRGLLFTITTGLFTALTQYLLGWQMVMFAPFLLSLVWVQPPAKAFVRAFWGTAICWAIAILRVDIPNNHLLATKLAALFHLHDPFVFMGVNAIFGGLLGGLGALAAALIQVRNPLRLPNFSGKLKANKTQKINK